MKEDIEIEILDEADVAYDEAVAGAKTSRDTGKARYAKTSMRWKARRYVRAFQHMIILWTQIYRPW